MGWKLVARHPDSAITRFCLGLAIAGAVSFLAGCAGSQGKDSGSDGIPVVSATGPYPKLVLVGERVHNFGTMTYGSKGEHTFEVKNEGEAPLELVAREEDTTCQCTVGSVAQKAVAAGESTTVTLEWEIKNPNPKFRHSAILRSNDPARPQITLEIQGEVGQLVYLTPNEVWKIGDIGGDDPLELKGAIYSPIIEEFKAEIPPSLDPHLDVRLEAMSEERLEELKAKSGYDILVTLDPHVPIGPYRNTVTLQTDILQFNDVSLRFEGHRQGPFEVLAKPGVRFIPAGMLIDLGEFPSKEGFTGEVSVFVSDMEGETFEISTEEVVPDFLKVEVTPDPKFAGKSRQRFDLKVTVPPMDVPVSRTRNNLARIRFKTNHPSADELVLRVEFVAR